MGHRPDLAQTTTNERAWRNWQTQRSLKPPPWQDCGFESRRPHSNISTFSDPGQ